MARTNRAVVRPKYVAEDDDDDDDDDDDSEVEEEAIEEEKEKEKEKEEERERCGVCKAVMGPGGCLRMACDHSFHSDCLDSYQKRFPHKRNQCPVCRPS